ncbi:hypothetical protein E1A91_A08G022900v1 [Gossypium mustelinum]|uniref:Uncharacterized protein n=1 Tax=Gossypium mustelinum TaxID=34275 RepID=A0A5D2Y3U3_GOSMU|nr:hypothetical protein E1A91_A08G022900v1 [Gossypium mustelinum]
MPVSGFGSYDDGFSSQRSTAEAATLNFQFFSWETCQPVGSFLPQPEWTAWDQTVEYCALAYQRYIVISTLRPQYRYLGDVAISHATGAVWQRRQLFVATPTTIECVFVDAGVAPIDIETRKRKEEMKLREAQARALAGHGELALINVDGPQAAKEEKITLRPPMLQVVRLASFQHAPSVPHFLSLPKKFQVGGDDMEERKVNGIAVGGGGVSVAVTRFPTEQKRPVGPVIVVGVRDRVLWLIDRYMTVHALSLSHPGIRCRCLAAYGDAVSAVKWAIRLAREHHDDLAQFLLGMGYANEALHLPGISKRLEFDLAMKSNDLKRALQCLLKMSNSRDMGQDNPGLDKNDILNLTAKKENLVEAVQGIVKFAKEFLDLIDAADATAQVDIAREALKRLATAGSVKGALPGHELRGLALRLANHGELTRLSGLGTNLISLGLGQEAAFAAALLGDNAHMEKAWQDTGMLAEAVLHAHAHGRSTLKNLVEAWNKALQKEVDHIPTAKTDATAAFLAALELKLSSLSEAGKKPPIEIFPPGMSALSSSIVIKKNPAPATQTSQQQSNTPLAIEGPRPSGPIGAPIGAPSPSASAAVPGTPIGAPTPSAPAATQGTPVEAAPPGEAAAKQGTPIGAPSLGATAATSGMPIGAPPPDTAAATPGTPVGAPPPDTPTATPGMTIGAPPPGTPAATAGMAIGVPSPGTSAGTPGMAIGAPPPSTSVATPDMPIGATPTSAAAPAARTPIEAPPPGAQAETSATPSRGPPTDASAATPGMATGAPPPAAKKGTTTGASPPAETSGMTTRAPTPDAPDATPGKPIEAPPPGAPASRPGTPIGSPPPAALAATTGMPVGAPPTSARPENKARQTEAPCPAAPDARQGSPIGAPAATPGMSIGAPAATSGTPIAASTPGAPAATPSTSIGTPIPNAPAATVGKPIGAPPPGAPAAAATGAPPPISGASEPGSDDKSAISSSGNQHTTASVESNPTKSINDKPADATPTDKPLADVPSLTPDNQETSVPTTDPTSEPLA